MQDLFQRAETDLRIGRIGRREFMTLALAGGATLATATAAANRVLAATPKQGGDAIFGLAGANTTDSMDPSVVPDSFTITLKRGVYSTLTEIDPDGNLIGEVAESWDASDDAAVWRFVLRKGIEFHDGRPVKAEDVIASVNLHLGEESKSPLKGQLSALKEVKADGETVVFTLESGNADFPDLLSDFNLTVMPAVDGKADWMSGIGTGAYVLKEFEPGVKAVTERNSNYFKTDRAHFDSVTALAINDDTARVSALITREVHAINRVNPKVAKRLAENDGVNLAVVTGAGHYVFEMSMAMDPVSDNHVRLALKHGIDREAFVRSILNGFGSVANDQPIGTTYRYYDSSIPQRGYDPDKAKFHLKEAGLESLDIQLHAADAAFQGAVDAAVIYSEQAKKCGINITPVRAPDDGYWSDIWGQKAWFAGWWGGRPTEDAMFSVAYQGGAGWNATGFNNPRFDELLLTARAELDSAKRAEMYSEMQMILRDEGGTVVPAFFQYIDAYSDKIGTLGMSKGVYGTGDMRAFERWWLKA